MFSSRRRVSLAATAWVAAAGLALSAIVWSGSASGNEAERGRASVAGLVTNGAKVPLGGISVTLSALDQATGALIPVTTVKTASDGRWSYTLSRPLPSALQAIAAANGGYVNLLSTASGRVGSQTLSESHFQAVDTRKPVSRATALKAAGGQRQALAPVFDQHLAADGLAVARPRTMVANGVDYSRAVPLDNPCWVNSTRIKSEVHYTTVAETHAYWDVTSRDAYTSTMSSSITVGGAAAGASGSVTDEGSTSIGAASNWVGPYKSLQYQVPIRYYYVKYVHHCVHGTDSTTYGVEPGAYDPDGGATSQWGSSVASDDGPAKFKKVKSKKRRAVLPCKGNQAIASSGKSTSMTAGLVYGESISVTTSWGSNHSETIQSGNTCRHRIHHIWVAGSSWTHPKMIYSD